MANFFSQNALFDCCWTLVSVACSGNWPMNTVPKHMLIDIFILMIRENVRCEGICQSLLITWEIYELDLVIILHMEGYLLIFCLIHDVTAIYRRHFLVSPEIGIFSLLLFFKSRKSTRQYIKLWFALFVDFHEKRCSHHGQLSCTNMMPMNKSWKRCAISYYEQNKI
jgi:hypothetical protein